MKVAIVAILFGAAVILATSGIICIVRIGGVDSVIDNSHSITPWSYVAKKYLRVALV
jgi:hypothetical protein